MQASSSPVAFKKSRGRTGSDRVSVVRRRDLGVQIDGLADIGEVLLDAGAESGFGSARRT
ncbi:MAG: hypothetical protein PGN34_07590 [Methylobacterium frigidaeris]